MMASSANGGFGRHRCPSLPNLALTHATALERLAQGKSEGGPVGGLKRNSSLPNLVPQTHAASLDLGSYIGVDIGGTLTKMVFLEKPGKKLGRKLRDFLTSSTKIGTSGERDQELSVDVEDGRLHFVFFPSSQIEASIKLIRKRELQQDVKMVYTAGGGAYKYLQLFRDKLDVKLLAADELETVVRGISWLAEHVPGEVYVVEDGKNVPLEVLIDGTGPPLVAMSSMHGSGIVGALPSTSDVSGEDSMVPLFPLLIVNIGTGVSIVKVMSYGEFERVSGTALGGGTYWGLCQLLTGFKDFELAAKLASTGDAGEVNLEIRDIYGGDYVLPNGNKLPGSLTASFFAKSGQTLEKASKSGVLRALVTMIAQNVCQIALLNMRIHDVKHVVFTGNFLRQNPVAVSTISSNFERVAAVSGMGIRPRALFLRHEGYFGALGSLLLNWHTNSEARVAANCGSHTQRLRHARSQRPSKRSEKVRMGPLLLKRFYDLLYMHRLTTIAFCGGCAAGAVSVVIALILRQLWLVRTGRAQNLTVLRATFARLT